MSSETTTNEGARQYSVSGLDDRQTYDVALFPAEAVSVDDNGVVTFTDEDGTNNAGDDFADEGAAGDVVADIEVVNGQAVLVEDTERTEVRPVNGSISLTVDSENPDSIVSVVFLDGQTVGGGANDLNLDANNQPTEAFGIGGRKTCISAEADSGDLASDEVITSVDKGANQIFTASNLYNYDTNDNCFIVTGSSDADASDDTQETSTSLGEAHRVTMTEFESQLSPGDQLDGFTFYQANEELPSRFVLEDVAPVQPGTPTAANTTDTATTLTFGNVDEDATQVTVYCEVDPSTDTTDDATVNDDVDADVTTNDDVCATATQDADATTDGFQVVVTGLTLDTNYDLAGTQTVAGEGSAISDEVEVTTATEGATVAPTITNAELTNDAFTVGLVDSGDVWDLQFSEGGIVFTGGAATNGLFDLRDADGDVIRVQCNANAAAATAAIVATDGVTEAACVPGDDDNAGDTVDGDELVITLAEDAEDRNLAGNGDIEYPVTITAVDGIEDADGNEIDLANSSDVLVNDEA